MAGELVVVAADLRARAAAIAGTDWPDYPQDHLEAPCHIQPAQDALLNLAGNYLVLAGHEESGKLEGARLSETLTNVAIAYDTLDKDAAHAVERGGPAPAPIQVAPCSTTPPGQVPHLAALGAPGPGEGDVPLTDRQLKAGDQGASLTAAAAACAAQAARLRAMSEAYKVDDLNWDGDAAEAADARFTAFKDWIDELADSYTTLADEANKVLQAHEKARKTHDPIADRYNELLAELQRLSTQPSVDPHRVQQIFDDMTKLNDESQQVRNAYAGQAATKPVQPDRVPTGSIGPASVSANERPRSNVPPGVRPGNTGGSGSGGSRGGATGATGATMPDSAGIQNAAQTTGTGERGSTGPGGGSPGGGGSPSGSGLPSGVGAPGGLPGGLPDGGTRMPTLPDDPSLHPAAASGGGGSGGGGGGGIPSMPLQPSLGGSAVGPGPSGGAAGGGAGPVVASANGGMGGIAGGAPMHGAGHGQADKEKKRNPGLSPDENIYAEERPWTEPVIGNRRRKEVADTSKDSK